NTTTGQLLLDTSIAYNAASLGDLTAGASNARSYTFTLPEANLGAGTLHATVTSDSGNMVLEYNTAGHDAAEGTNIATGTITAVLAPYPDLQVANMTLTPAD